MPALIETGISNRQLLAVWSTNADIGFTPAQLLVAGISIAEMQSNEISLLQIHASGISLSNLLAKELLVPSYWMRDLPSHRCEIAE